MSEEIRKDNGSLPEPGFCIKITLVGTTYQMFCRDSNTATVIMACLAVNQCISAELIDLATREIVSSF